MYYMDESKSFEFNGAGEFIVEIYIPHFNNGYQTLPHLLDVITADQLTAQTT